MGYISAQTATTLTVQLTEEGRNLMLTSGSFINLFQKFGISDGDIDYRSSQMHADSTTTANDSPQKGYLPDVTGQDSNYKNSVSNGYRQNNIVWQTPDANKVFNRTKKYVAVGVRGTDNLVKYYRNEVEIDVYLSDYYVLCKLFASKYIEDQQMLSSADTTINDSMTNYFENTLNINSNSEYLNLLNTLSEHGIGQYIDYVDSVKVYDGTNFSTQSIKLVPEKDDSYYNALALAGGAFMNRGQHTGISFQGTNLKGMELPSPFSLVFSPGLDENGAKYIRGAGRYGIGFAAFDMGYLNCGGTNIWNQNGESYPTFIMDSTLNGWVSDAAGDVQPLIGFVSNIDMEREISLNDGGFGNPAYKNINTTIPTSRLVVNVTNRTFSPLYYPIKMKRLTKSQGEYININQEENKGIRITYTTHPSDTFGLLMGSMEYTANWNTSQQGLKSDGPYFSLFPSKDGGLGTVASKVVAETDPYYTLYTRHAKMADDIFTTIASQNNNYWKTDTYTGGYIAGLSGSGLTSYNISIPITWNVYSSNSSDVAPCKLTVRFKFNKPAIEDCIAYTNTSSQNYYRMYDNATFRFYGEAGADRSSYSEDPRGHNSSNAWQTSGGKALFFKVTYGQIIN
tara:strand:- start:8408 stop:10276 length:1869 start_codon:yes stop_codon:yes gene_type:complete